MAANNLALFEDLVRNNTPNYLTGPEDLINDAQEHQDYWIGMEAKSNRLYDSIQGGASIEDRVFLNVAKRMMYYHPDDSTVTYKRNDVTQSIVQNWAFIFTHVAWSKHEVRNAFSRANSGKGKRGLLIKDFIRAKYMEMWTDFNDQLEDGAFVKPDPTTMAGIKAKQPVSLPYFVNEFTDTLFPGFDNVLGIDPRVEQNWRNYKGTYAKLPSAQWDLYQSMSQAMRKTMFKKMPHRGEHSTLQTKAQDIIIATDSDGLDDQELAVQINQDITRRPGGGSEDPYAGDLQFRGVPIHWFPSLDGQEIYATGTAGAASYASNTANSNAGPRYMGLNAKTIRMVWHDEAYMEQMDVQTDASQPWTRALPFDSQANRICRSRRHNWIISPSATLT